jgi:hypothetical protein
MCRLRITGSKHMGGATMPKSLIVIAVVRRAWVCLDMQCKLYTPEGQDLC